MGVRTVTVEGLVAAVDGGQIVLNVGTKAGVKVGDQLEVLRVTKEIKDPAVSHFNSINVSVLQRGGTPAKDSRVKTAVIARLGDFSPDIRRLSADALALH